MSGAGRFGWIGRSNDRLGHHRGAVRLWYLYRGSMLTDELRQWQKPLTEEQKQELAAVFAYLERRYAELTRWIYHA